MKTRKLLNHETAKALGNAALRRAREKNDAEQHDLTTAFIEAGRGHWRNAEIQKAADSGDTLSQRQLALYAEARAIHYEAERRYGPGWIVHV